MAQTVLVVTRGPIRYSLRRSLLWRLFEHVDGADWLVLAEISRARLVVTVGAPRFLNGRLKGPDERLGHIIVTF